MRGVEGKQDQWRGSAWFEVETLARRRDGEWKPRGCWGGRDSRVSDFLELRTGVGVFGDFLGAICGFCEPKDDLLDEERNLGEGQVGCHAPVTKFMHYSFSPTYFSMKEILFAGPTARTDKQFTM